MNESKVLLTKRKSARNSRSTPHRKAASGNRLDATARGALQDIPKRPRGRPSKYGPETVELTRAYLDGHKSLGDLIPTIASLCIILGVDHDTVSRWRRAPDKREFRGLLDELKMRQERELINAGLSGQLNSAIVKLLLHKHGYITQTAHHVGGDSAGVPVTIVGCSSESTLSANEAARLYFAALNPK